MPDLAVLIPTRGRPGNIAKVISAWDFTNAWDHADMIVIADADDPQIQAYRDLEQANRHPDNGTNLFTLAVMDEWKPMVHKLNDVADFYARLGTYFALGFAGDDHLPQTMGWAERYLTVLRELGSGMVFGDDGYQGANLSTEWAVTADVVRELGRMVPADVEHMYCDNSIMEMFAEAGALRHLPEVRIEHMHPITGKAESDEQYRRVNHRDQFAKDRRAYEGWRNGDVFRTDVAAVRHLRQGRPEVRPAKETRSIRPGSMPRAVKPRPRGGTGGRRFPFPRHFRNVRGATPEVIGFTLADFASQVPADQEIVELGVFQGKTSLQLAWGARQGNGAHVTGFDAWDLPGNTYGPPFNEEGSRTWARYNVMALGYNDRIALVQDFASDAAAAWRGKPIGLLFVDDDHSYAGARRAIEDWSVHLADVHRIAVDDYGHPDWPGVKMAVDDLVEEGFIVAPEIFHDRLAVTRLTGKPRRSDLAVLPGVYDEVNGGRIPPIFGTAEELGVTAITAEGVSPSPYPAMPDQVAVPTVASHTATVPVRPTEDVELPEAVDSAPSKDWAWKVTPEEAVALTVPVGPVADLNTVQLRALAKHRGIVLGARKDKRDLMIEALREGR